jgi:hypothetical protein
MLQVLENQKSLKLSVKLESSYKELVVLFSKTLPSMLNGAAQPQTKKKSDL